MAKNNGVCGTGIAYEAKIAGTPPLIPRRSHVAVSRTLEQRRYNSRHYNGCELRER